MFFHGFMQRAFIAGTAIAVITPIIGLFLILRKQSLMSDTLSHVALVGVALGLMLGQNITFSTIATAVIAALIIEYISKYFKGYSEIAVAILMSSGMAIALILIHLQRGTTTISVDQFLFGSIVTISHEQVAILIGLMVVIVSLYIIFRKPLYVLSFDADTAHTAGLPVKFMSSIFSVLTGVVIAIMMPIAGALLVSAIIVLPASISIRLSKSFTGVILLGICISLFGIFTGLTTSYHFDSPPGATITCIFVLLLLLSLVYSSWRNRSRSQSKK